LTGSELLRAQLLVAGFTRFRFCKIQGETGMFETRRLLGLAIMLLGAAVLLPVPAHAIDLTGAWASQSDLCKLVFTKKGNEIVFTELSDLYGSGFVINGDQIRGKAARCTITSRKQDGDKLQLNASCASTIMTQNVSFLLKVIDDNSIARVMPEIENMEIKYARCSF
jgi:hypothetical protein